MICPMIHPEGTSKDELLQQTVEAIAAVWRALEAMSAAAPHARDYSPQGPDAYKQALRDHLWAMDQLMLVLNHLKRRAAHLQVLPTDATVDKHPISTRHEGTIVLAGEL
jgi:hypothetical protein